MYMCFIYQYVHIYIYKQSLDIYSNAKYNFKISIIIFYYTI